MKDLSWTPSEERVPCWVDGLGGVNVCRLDGKLYEWPYGWGPDPERGLIDAAWVRKHGKAI